MRSHDEDLSPGRMGEDAGTDEAGQGGEFVDEAATEQVDEEDAKAWFKAYEPSD
jgi:hypothetical protein